MNSAQARAFSDELTKIAFFGEMWQRFLDLFRRKEDVTTRRVKRRVDYHFSPRAGGERWNKFVRNTSDKEFVNQVKKHPLSDEKLNLHAASMHDLTKGRVVAKIRSSRVPGKSYEVKKLPGGRLGCTCNDWRFKGSVNPLHDCKHIKAFRAGKSVAG